MVDADHLPLIDQFNYLICDRPLTAVSSFQSPLMRHFHSIGLYIDLWARKVRMRGDIVVG